MKLDSNDHEIEEMSKSWISHTIKSIDVEIIEFDESAYEVDRLCQKNPELAWEIIKHILYLCKNDHLEHSKNKFDVVKENLAAGPLEDLLVYNGLKIIDKIENDAIKNKDIIDIIRMIWKNNIDLKVWEEILKMSG